jgi:hypothetical protein
MLRRVVILECPFVFNLADSDEAQQASLIRLLILQDDSGVCDHVMIT